MREKIKRLKEHKFFPLICYSAAIFGFGLLFTRYFIKMDDGNFLGIVYSPDFTYRAWLTQRYNTLSGRTFGELLLALFMRHSIVWWKLANSTIIVLLSFFWYKLSEMFGGELSLRRRQLFCCAAMFLMMVSCLNPAVFWCAGAFTYLWPFFGLCVTVMPLVFYVLGGKFSTVGMILSAVSAFLATAQEQSAAAVTALYVILLIIIIFGKFRFRLSMLAPLPIIAVCDFHLFASPGAAARGEMEANAGFERYIDFDVFDKLGCGFSMFFANSFYLSFFLALLLVALLSLAVYSVCRRGKRLLIGINAFAFVACVAVNFAVCAVKRGLAHMVFRAAIQKGEYDICFWLLIAFGCAMLVTVAALAVALLVRDRRTGLFVSICLAAALGCALVMGFSSSIFASGQRPYFFTNVFVITACVALISYIPKSKLSETAYKASLIYAFATFAINCVAFRVAEIPLMG